jgi:hypothetical protein
MKIWNLKRGGGNEFEKFIGDISRILKVGGSFVATNVHADFQKTFSDSYMSHEYPKPDSFGKFPEGTGIRVKLKKDDGSEIGPFSNFHYSLDYLQEVCSKFGLELEQNISLDTKQDLEVDKKLSAPKYSIFVFRKKE